MGAEEAGKEAVVEEVATEAAVMEAAAKARGIAAVEKAGRQVEAAEVIWVGCVEVEAQGARAVAAARAAVQRELQSAACSLREGRCGDRGGLGMQMSGDRKLKVDLDGSICFACPPWMQPRSWRHARGNARRARRRSHPSRDCRCGCCLCCLFCTALPLLHPTHTAHRLSCAAPLHGARLAVLLAGST